MSILSLSKALAERKISARELAEQYFEKISECDGQIGAYITVCRDRALAKADLIDKRRANGEQLFALSGIPFAAKDNFCTDGVRTTCGSKMLENFMPPYTATVIERLEGQGALLLGKTNMDEFGMGSTTATSFFGQTKNPFDCTRTAGGSSGGSAAAVAARMAAFSIASDTGGSVRLPAAFCGCVGLKPTRGLLSRYGLVAFASSLDTVGVIAGDIEDTELVFGSVLGKDARDATSLDMPAQRALARPLKVGLCEDSLLWAAPQISDSILRAAECLERAGVQVLKIQLPPPDLCVATYYVICTAEACSNLSRFDGIRYGYRADGADSIAELFFQSRSQGFGEEVKRRIALGTFCLHGEGREQYYAAACAARADITGKLLSTLEECDALLLPVYPTVSPKIGDAPRSSLELWRADALCTLANLSGLPALSLPFGRCEEMPVGVQLMGRAYSEQMLFELGKTLSEAEND